MTYSGETQRSKPFKVATPNKNSIMSNSTPTGTPARSGGLSLYANLLDTSGTSANTSASISRGPVVFNRASNDATQSDDAASKKQQIDAGRLHIHVSCIFGI